MLQIVNQFDGYGGFLEVSVVPITVQAYISVPFVRR